MAIKLETFVILRCLPGVDVAELRELNDGSPPEEAQYTLSYMIDTACSGQSFITAARRLAIGSHPSIRHRPGQLTAGYVERNPQSRRVIEIGTRDSRKIA